MKRYLIIILALFLTQGLKAKNISSAEPIIKYVSFQKQGSGSGENEQNAADFLSDNFWEGVQAKLQNRPVTVRFLPGEYTRAYTEKRLELRDFGHEENRLTIEGNQSIFVVSPNGEEQAYLFNIVDAQNITIRNLQFTGDGRLGYALRIASSPDGKSTNILIENCTWTDMRGIIYGATGVHSRNSSYVTYRNCTFKRIGIDSHSHHMYHAYSPSHIYVYDSHFEDCTGDYVRFRDQIEHGYVSGSTFIRNNDFPVYPFISVPLFSRNRREYFGTNYSFTNNSFTNARYAIAFHHYGYSPDDVNYLLTAEEGKILESGDPLAKKNLLKKNFGIDTDKITITGNQYTNITDGEVAMGSFNLYGAESNGWRGWGIITETFLTQ